MFLFAEKTAVLFNCVSGFYEPYKKIFFIKKKNKKKASYETFYILIVLFSIHPHSKDNHLL
jgi:hypothetical protein